MAVMNFKDFLTRGACLQTGPDTFKLLIGPFVPAIGTELESANTSTFLYKSNFWNFLNTDKNSAQNSVFRVAQVYDLNREDFIGLLQAGPASEPRIEWEAVQETGFQKQYEWSFGHFENKNLLKTVPVICQSAKVLLDEANKRWLLLQLLKNKNPGWTYCYFENENGMLGHTPETLLVWNRPEEKGETMALAGTVAAGPMAKNEILNDKKIMQEHLFVVDDIEQRLNGFNVFKEKTNVLELRHLLHLKTDFIFSLKNKSAVVDCIERLHPTAAMGIFPNNPERMQEFAGFDLQSSREGFAAPFGYIDQDSARILVSIRNIIFDAETIHTFSGCGITADSVYAKEMEELNNKRNSVKKMLGLLND